MSASNRHRATAMSPAIELADQSSIEEAIARSFEMIAASRKLLARPLPTTFLGKRHYPPLLIEDPGTS